MLTYFGALIIPHISARFPIPIHATNAMSHRELVIFVSMRSLLTFINLILGLLTENIEFVFVGKYTAFPKLQWRVP